MKKSDSLESIAFIQSLKFVGWMIIWSIVTRTTIETIHRINPSDLLTEIIIMILIWIAGIFWFFLIAVAYTVKAAINSTVINSKEHLQI